MGIQMKQLSEVRWSLADMQWIPASDTITGELMRGTKMRLSERSYYCWRLEAAMTRMGWCSRGEYE
jgi:hypothetical protein